MLTYAEANLFCRAGDDVRRKVFPAGDFVRWIDAPAAPVITGYESLVYVPTEEDLRAADWRLT